LLHSFPRGFRILLFEGLPQTSDPSLVGSAMSRSLTHRDSLGDKRIEACRHHYNGQHPRGKHDGENDPGSGTFPWPGFGQWAPETAPQQVGPHGRAQPGRAQTPRGEHVGRPVDSEIEPREPYERDHQRRQCHQHPSQKPCAHRADRQDGECAAQRKMTTVRYRPVARAGSNRAAQVPFTRFGHPPAARGLGLSSSDPCIPATSPLPPPRDASAPSSGFPA